MQVSQSPYDTGHCKHHNYWERSMGVWHPLILGAEGVTPTGEIVNMGGNINTLLRDQVWRSNYMHPKCFIQSPGARRFQTTHLFGLSAKNVLLSSLYNS